MNASSVFYEVAFLYFMQHGYIYKGKQQEQDEEQQQQYTIKFKQHKKSQNGITKKTGKIGKQ